MLLVDTGGTLVGGDSGKDAGADELQVRAMAEMRYDALNAGPGELGAGPLARGRLAAASAPALVASNVSAGSEEHGTRLSRPYVVREVSGVRLGLVGVASVAPAGGGPVNASLRPPADALRALLPEVRRQADVIVGLADLEPAEVGALAAAGLDLQVVLGGRDVDPREAGRVGDTIVAAAGSDGRYVGRLTLQIDGGGRIISYEGEHRALDGSVPEDLDLLALRGRYW